MADSTDPSPSNSLPPDDSRGNGPETDGAHSGSRSFNLAEKFPDLVAISQPPSLNQQSAIGLRFMGRRDFDEETHTYVTSRVFQCIVPLFAVDAYRVADSPQGGWYILGKVPLSRFGKLSRLYFAAAIVLIVVGIGCGVYFSSDGYADNRKLRAADRLAAGGQIGQAARAYQKLMRHPSTKQRASEAVVELASRPVADAKETAELFAVLMDEQRRGFKGVDEIYQKGRKAAETLQQNDPLGASAVLRHIAPLTANPAEHLAAQSAVLEQAVKKSPEDVEIVSQWAEVLEDLGQDAKCRELLEPLKGRLGSSSGSAVLGRLYSAEGKLDEAEMYLNAYASAGLPKLIAAHSTSSQEVAATEQKMMADLNAENPPSDFPTSAYRNAAQADKNRIVSEYFEGRLQANTAWLNAQSELEKNRGAVQATMDLGAVQLRLAQAVNDPAKRKVALEKAESTFLSVQLLASKSDDFRLNLGRVYHWMGRGDKSRELFDQAIKESSTPNLTTLRVCGTLREIGDLNQARILAEKLFEESTVPAERHLAARMRSVMSKDLDDRLEWLGKCNPDEPLNRADLAAARAERSIRDGKDDEAVKQLRECVAIYEKEAVNPASLNNAALALFQLHGITRDEKDFQLGMDKLDRAIAIEGNDAILLSNAAGILWEAALRSTVGESMDMKAIRSTRPTELWPYLYDNSAERSALIRKFKTHPGFIRAKAYSDKLMLIAPKRPESYSWVLWLANVENDASALKQVEQRLRDVELDTSDDDRALKEYYDQSNQKRIDEFRTGMARIQEDATKGRALGGRTAAAAVCKEVEARIRGRLYEIKCDINAVVAEAEKAHAMSPSAGTAKMLIDALFARANDRLQAADPAYAEVARRTRRVLGDELISWNLGFQGPFADKLKVDPDVNRAVQLGTDLARRIPEENNLVLWLSIEAIDPVAGKEIAERMRKRESIEVARSIGAKMSPLRSSNFFGRAILAKIRGDQAGIKSAIEEMKAKGLAVP